MNDRVYETRPGRTQLPTRAEMPSEPPEEITQTSDEETAADEILEGLGEEHPDEVNEAQESHPRKHAKAKAAGRK
jgi:hypothetical protein